MFFKHRNKFISTTFALHVKLRGPGEVEIYFSVVSDRMECKLLNAFYQIKKYCSYPKLLDFEILKNGQLQCARNFYTRFPKNGHFRNLKIYLLQFLRYYRTRNSTLIHYTRDTVNYFENMKTNVKHFNEQDSTDETNW